MGCHLRLEVAAAHPIEIVRQCERRIQILDLAFESPRLEAGLKLHKHGIVVVVTGKMPHAFDHTTTHKWCPDEGRVIPDSSALGLNVKRARSLLTSLKDFAAWCRKVESKEAMDWWPGHETQSARVRLAAKALNLEKYITTHQSRLDAWAAAAAADAEKAAIKERIHASRR